MGHNGSRDSETRGLAPSHWIRMAMSFALYPAILFGGAGTIAWPQAWVFLGALLGFTAILFVMLKRHDPELLRERAGPMFRPEQHRSDKRLMSVFVVVYVGWMLIAGFDAVRFSWSWVPSWLQIAGGAALLASLALLYKVFRTNTFLSPVVKIQADRGHRVIDTGPYAVVRHPMYAAFGPMLVGSSLLLGSWYAVGLAVVMILILGVRIALEEQTLRDELDGYAAYTRRVRFRMIPGIW